jgi:hypothetical protein
MVETGTTNRLTLKGVQAELRGLGLVVVSRPEFGEFEVRQKGIVGGGYFTDCLEDARDTGRAMRAQADRLDAKGSAA